MAQIAPNILILPDGNRRWARKHKKNFVEGYEQTAVVMHALAAHLDNLGAEDVWFAVSRPFNMLRDPAELNAVFRACARLYEIGQEKGAPINVRVAGDVSNITSNYLDKLNQQELTGQSGRITAHLLFDWSSDTEVAELFRYAQKHPSASSGLNDLRAISVIGQKIDLIIRTGLLRANHSGRLSGFAPWHSMEADLMFPPKLFQDFTTNDLDDCLLAYRNAEHKNQIAVE